MQRISTAIQRWRIYAQDMHANGQAAWQTVCQTADCCARALDAVRFTVQNTQLTFGLLSTHSCALCRGVTTLHCERQVAPKRLAGHKVRIFGRAYAVVCYMYTRSCCRARLPREPILVVHDVLVLQPMPRAANMPRVDYLSCFLCCLTSKVPAKLRLSLAECWWHGLLCQQQRRFYWQQEQPWH